VDPTRPTQFVWKLTTSNDYQELPLMYTNWNVGEPNNFGGAEACLHAVGNGVWNDTPCTHPKCYVCEFDM